MIELSVVTVMRFKSEEDLHRFTSEEAYKLTGFASEIETAWKKKELLNVKTHRPKYGAVVESFIEVKEVNS